MTVIEVMVMKTTMEKNRMSPKTKKNAFVEISLQGDKLIDDCLRPPLSNIHVLFEYELFSRENQRSFICACFEFLSLSPQGQCA